MKNDSRAHRAYTPEEISDWIRRYRGSGLALGTFAEQHGLSRNRLHYWVYDRRFSQPRRPAVAAPVFQEIKLSAGLLVHTWAAEISLPTGAVVRFTATATPGWIYSIMEALPRPCWERGQPEIGRRHERMKSTLRFDPFMNRSDSRSARRPFLSLRHPSCLALAVTAAGTLRASTPPKCPS